MYRPSILLVFSGVGKDLFTEIGDGFVAGDRVAHDVRERVEMEGRVVDGWRQHEGRRAH